MENDLILQCQGVSKSFSTGTGEIAVLKDIDLTLKRGETCAILGPSGSGKSTLLSLAAGLDRPNSGRVILDNKEISSLEEDELSEIRSRSVGFVFQNFQLLPSLTALDNVRLPVELRDAYENDGRGKTAVVEALHLLERVGLAERSGHYPWQLSGGEQQRVALARAFINKPAILFADEPTGSLDAESAELALEAMFELNNHFKASLLLVTHDESLGRRLSRRIILKGGRIVADE